MNDIQIDTLGYFVDRTYTNMVKFLNSELSKTNLELQHPQFTLLMVLSKKDGIPQSLINEVVDRDRASVSRNLKYLEKKEYIQKVKKGGKKKLIFLTQKGKSILPIINEIANKDTECTLKDFTEREKKTIYHLLTRMYKNISSSIDQ